MLPVGAVDQEIALTPPFHPLTDDQRAHAAPPAPLLEVFCLLIIDPPEAFIAAAPIETKSVTSPQQYGPDLICISAIGNLISLSSQGRGPHIDGKRGLP